MLTRIKGCADFGRVLCCSSVKDHSRYAPSSRRAPGQNSQQRCYTSLRLDALACIGHKSLEICDRCRLWQRNSPATPENSAAFWKGEFKNSLFRFLYSKTGSQTDAERLFKSFLARNELVASVFA